MQQNVKNDGFEKDFRFPFYLVKLKLNGVDPLTLNYT